MKSIITYNIALIVLLSCTSISNKAKSQIPSCKENEIFKKEFYKNIRVIDSLITKNQDDTFNKSLKFISKYASVDFSKTLNYSRVYPYETYLNDRKKWIDWYERNKCNNIQLKK